MSEASDRVLCKRMVRFGKDLVLDVNQVTAVVTTTRADTVHLDDGREIDVSEESANLVRDYFGSAEATTAPKDGEDKQDAQDGKAEGKRSAVAKARAVVGLILCAMLDALGAAGGEDGEDGDEDKGEGAGEEAKES